MHRVDITVTQHMFHDSRFGGGVFNDYPQKVGNMHYSLAKGDKVRLLRESFVSGCNGYNGGE